jgi:K+-transporting ATPase A subunit
MKEKTKNITRSILWIALPILFLVSVFLISNQVLKYRNRKCIEWRMRTLLNSDFEVIGMPTFKMTKIQRALCDKYLSIFDDE